MRRNLATPEDIAAYHKRQKEGGAPARFDGDRCSSDGMTLEEVAASIKGLKTSGYKIPKALLRRPPSQQKLP